MRARIERGRIKVQLEAIEESIWFPQKEEIFRLIGSSNHVKDDERQVSCALSVQNFKKLKDLGCGLSNDTHTREVIKLMKDDWDLYRKESQDGNRTKEGHDWCKDYVFKKKPFDHQILGFQFLHSMSRPALFGDCGTGKGLPLSAKVLTPDGWVEMKTIAIGDLVLASNGNAYPVEGVFDQGEQDIYTVTFSDKTSTVCDGAHLWSVKSFNDVARNKSWRTMSTLKLIDTDLKYGARQQSRRWRIPMASPSCFRTTELPIHPYILGVLLGDGNITTATPKWTSDDLEIYEKIKTLLPKDIVARRLKTKNRTPTWSIRKKKRNNAPNPITEKLEALKLAGCKSDKKFVPEQYLYGSPEDRIELLRGLLDTDGSGPGYIEFSSTSKTLSEDLVFLVQSLGGTASIAPRQTSYTHEGEKRDGLPSWRVHLSMPSTIQPFHLERKKLDENRLEPRRCIDSIEPCGRAETRCIRVGSPDGTFITEQFVVTHNTFMVLTYGESLMQKEKWCFLVVCPVNLIRHVWLADAEKFTNLSCLGLRDETVTRVLVRDFDEGADRTDPDEKKKARRRASLRRNKALKEKFTKDADIYVVNPESLRTDPKEKLVKDLLRRKIKEGYRICLVIDESSKLKSRTSRTYKALKRLRPLCEECIIMTGTPSPNGILDLWAQFSVLDDGLTLQKSFTDFRNDTHTLEPMYGVTYKDHKGVKQTVTTWKPKRGMPMKVYATIKDRMIRFRTDECIDLPPIRVLVRDVPLSKEQLDVYEDMENMLYTELEGEPSTAKVAVSKLIKLREITGGFLRMDNGDDVQIGKKVPKMIELDMLLEQSIEDRIGDSGKPSKALVWANYRWECRTLVERYKKRYDARGLFGGVSARAKDKAITKFMNDPKSKLLICHPGSVGHGLTLTEANYSFYYSLSHNYEELYQSYRRNARPGQYRPITYYFLVAPDTIDVEMLEAARAKKDLSDLITDGKFDRNSFLKHRKDQRNETFDFDWSIGTE